MHRGGRSRRPEDIARRPKLVFFIFLIFADCQFVVILICPGLVFVLHFFIFFIVALGSRVSHQPGEDPGMTFSLIFIFTRSFFFFFFFFLFFVIYRNPIASLPCLGLFGPRKVKRIVEGGSD